MHIKKKKALECLTVGISGRCYRGGWAGDWENLGWCWGEVTLASLLSLIQSLLFAGDSG